MARAGAGETSAPASPVAVEAAAVAPSPSAGSKLAAVQGAGGSLTAVREAYKAGNVDKTIAEHDARVARLTAGAPEDHAGAESDYVKSLIFGGLDGLVTTHATISSVLGGGLSVEANILLTLSNLISEAISMALGDGISSWAEAQYLLGRREAERRRFHADPAKRRTELKAVLERKGLGAADASELVDILSADKHADFFVDFCVSEDLGLELPDDPWAPFKDALMTLVSFLLFGAIPLVVYVICWASKYKNGGGIFGIASAASAVGLFVLGALQGKLTRQPVARMGLLMTLNGSLAAGAAYLAGWGISVAVGGHGGC